MNEIRKLRNVTNDNVNEFSGSKTKAHTVGIEENLTINRLYFSYTKLLMQYTHIEWYVFVS